MDIHQQDNVLEEETHVTEQEQFTNQENNNNHHHHHHHTDALNAFVSSDDEQQRQPNQKQEPRDNNENITQQQQEENDKEEEEDEDNEINDITMEGFMTHQRLRGKWNFDNEPQYKFDFYLTKKEENTYRGQFSLTNNQQQKVSETIKIHYVDLENKKLVGHGYNRFGEFTFIGDLVNDANGEMNPASLCFIAAKKYTGGPAPSRKGRRRRYAAVVQNPKQNNKSTRQESEEDGEEEADEEEDDGGGKQPRKREPQPVVPLEFTLEDYQSIVTITVVDETTDAVVLPSSHSTRHLKRKDYSLVFSREHMMIDSFGQDKETNIPRRPGKRGRKSKKELEELNNMYHSIEEEDDLGGRREAGFVLDEKEMDQYLNTISSEKKRRATIKTRDFVLNLPGKHFYPFNANDPSVGVPDWHPLKPHVQKLEPPADNEYEFIEEIERAAASSGKKRLKAGKRRKAGDLTVGGGGGGGVMHEGKLDHAHLEDVYNLFRSPSTCVRSGGKNEENQNENFDYVDAGIEVDGSVYEGDLVKGLRNGKGVCAYLNGNCYVGQFKQGLEHGIGELLDANDAIIYRGEFEAGKICGFGTFYYSDGCVYKGEMREGLRHGKGSIWYSDGSHYHGDFAVDIRSGVGKFVSADGSVYNGEWSNNVRHGKGELIIKDGERIEGNFLNNHPDGRCRVVFPNGDVYEGGFKDGLKDGRGSYVFKNNATYEGRFKNDQITGGGTLKLDPSASLYLNDSDWIIPISLAGEIKFCHVRAGFAVDGS